MANHPHGHWSNNRQFRCRWSGLCLGLRFSPAVVCIPSGVTKIMKTNCKRMNICILCEEVHIPEHYRRFVLDAFYFSSTRAELILCGVIKVWMHSWIAPSAVTDKHTHTHTHTHTYTRVHVVSAWLAIRKNKTFYTIRFCGASHLTKMHTGYLVLGRAIIINRLTIFGVQSFCENWPIKVRRADSSIIIEIYASRGALRLL